MLNGLLLCVASVVCTVGAEQASGADDASMTPLFNGHDLSGWVSMNCPPGTWTTKDGALVCTGKPTGLIRTERMYENFILELEWRHVQPRGNSGLFVWSDGVPAKGSCFTRAVEVQILDGVDGPGMTCHGDIFSILGAALTAENPAEGRPHHARPIEKHAKPSPEWNHYRVECIDGNISLAVNGHPVTRGRDARPRRGYICLESEGTEIHFRNLRIKELPPPRPPLPVEMSARTAEGWRSLFNGNFHAWTFGPAHEGHFRADDWRIAFDGQGEDLWTKESFGDFELIVDWRWTTPSDACPEEQRPVILPDGTEALDELGKPRIQAVRDAGDSGVYLRGNSKSQVNIWCWPVGSGEVYGYRTDRSLPDEIRAGVTPKKAADAPIGQWNRFEITMKGDRLSVTLNGERVIDNAHLPGVPEAGPIALQSHGGKIEFANIWIRELE